MGRYVYFNNGIHQFACGNAENDDLTHFGGKLVYRIDTNIDILNIGLSDKAIDFLYDIYGWENGCDEYYEESYYPDELNQMSEIWEGAIEISKNELDTIESKLVKFADETCIELPNLDEQDFQLYSRNVNVIYEQQYNYINNSNCNKWEKHRQNDIQAYGCYLYWFVKHHTDNILQIPYDIF